MQYYLIEKKSLKITSMAIVLLGISNLLGGCATTSLESETMPGVDLTTLKTFYVRKLPKDERGIDRIISDRLIEMGKISNSGSNLVPAQPVDAIITYQDKWMWDITMYMLQLSIQIRNPKNDMQLANGHIMRSSLQRRSPKEMVKEVLDRIFGLPATSSKKD